MGPGVDLGPVLLLPLFALFALAVLGLAGLGRGTYKELTLDLLAVVGAFVAVEQVEVGFGFDFFVACGLAFFFNESG